MASPVGHAIVGLTAAAVVARTAGAPPSPGLWGGAIIAAGLPDLDLALGLVGLRGPQFHRNASHSILVIVAVGLVAAAVAFGLRMDVDWRVAVCWFVALLSHPLLDVCTTGPTSAAGGWGIAMFWPLSPRRWYLRRPLFDPGDALVRCRSVRCVWQCLRPELLRLGGVCGAVVLMTLLV